MNEVGRAFAIANLWEQCYNDGTYTNMCILCKCQVECASLTTM